MKYTYKNEDKIRILNEAQAIEENRNSIFLKIPGRTLTEKQYEQYKKDPELKRKLRFFADIKDALSEMLDYYEANSPDNKKSFLRDNKYNDIAISKNINELCKEAAAIHLELTSIGKILAKIDNPDWNMLIAVSHICARYGIFRARINGEKPIARGIKILSATKEGGKIRAEETKKSDPVKMKFFMDKYFKDNNIPGHKPSFTQAAAACAKSFDCSIETVRNSVTNTYTPRK